MQRLLALLVWLIAALAPAWSEEPPLARRNQESSEALAQVETRFGELATPGNYRLRTIVTRPEGTRRRLPAIYFVQWLSCDTVEIGRDNDGWTQVLRALVSESGMVVMRLEKAGVGDSEGGPCSALDYETELAHNRLALHALQQHRWVDRRRIFVFGASMGANFAPLLANGERVRGVAVWGGGAQTWFERQLGFERRSLELGGATGAEIDARMRILSRIYSAILLRQASLEDLSESDPQLAAEWNLVTGSEGSTQFGRPIAFHQQAQAQHWAAAWAALDVPVFGDLRRIGLV